MMQRHSFFLFAANRTTPLQVELNRSKVSTFDNFPTERRTFEYNLAASGSELQRNAENADKSRVFVLCKIIKNISFLKLCCRVYSTSILSENDILESRKGKTKNKQKRSEEHDN